MHAPGSLPARAEALRALHVPGEPLIVVNVWDAATARTVAAVPGCHAVATASWAIAAAHGVGDGEVLGRDVMLAAVGRIAAAVELPVTADLERGYAGEPDGVAETTRHAIAAGVAGANLEDGLGDGTLRPAADAVERVRAMRAAAEAEGMPFVINARCDSLDAREVVQRGKAYLAAGADCVFAVNLADPVALATVVDEVGGPVSVLGRPGGPSLLELRGAGVARISFGPGGMGVALAALRDAAAGIFSDGPLPPELGFRPPAPPAPPGAG